MNKYKSSPYIYNCNKLKIESSNDIEKNPGPNETFYYVNKNNMFVLSYNVRGCKNLTN